MQFISTEYGTIVVNSKGIPVTSLPTGYEDIAKFNIRELNNLLESVKVSHTSTVHIMAVGYWTEDGKYHEPCQRYIEQTYSLNYEE